MTNKHLILILPLLVAACGQEMEDEPPVEPLPGTLVLGTADPDGTGFNEVADGSLVELVPGSQGGFHVWIGLRLEGMNGEYFVEREARRAEDDLLVLRGQRQRIEVPDEASGLIWIKPNAIASFMCPAPVGVQVWDNEIRFEVTLADDDGEVMAKDELSLIPTCPSGDEEEFCYRICSG